MKEYLVGTCVLNEGEKIKRMLSKCDRYDLYDVLVIDDGSTDGSLLGFDNHLSIKIIRNSINQGAGHCVRQIFNYAKENKYTAVFFVSGNDKDDPQDILKLKDAVEQGFDLVQGSRYLSGGISGKMPFYRKIATRLIHPALFSLVSGQRITDSTNGFRAVRISMLLDKRIDLDQPWLNQYELEPYLFYKAIKLGYKVKEVPVSKIYPDKKEGYTKMKPWVGWWSILRPLVYLGLGIKK
ncbi:MAG: glycosyltransferase family 2 protein [Candidatus Omnitrophota bacterium]